MRVGSSLAIACVMMASVASAQTPQAAATIQFDQGRALMKQHKYKEACAAFDRSQKLDAQSGTLFNLAECNAHLGKLATAWLAYRDLAQRDTNAGRKQEANRRAKDLEKRLPKLLVRIDAPPAGLSEQAGRPHPLAGLALTINGNDATSLVGIESPVDLGDYEIRATAPGYAPFETTRSVTVEGKIVKVSVELEKGAEPTPSHPIASTSHPTTEPTVRPQPEPGPVDEIAPSHRKRNGVLVGIAGGGLLAAGAVFGLGARSSWNDAEALCPSHTCATAADRQRGDALVDTARRDATVSTAFVVAGAAVAAAGVYLVVTARPAGATTALELAPARGGAVVVLGGRF